LTAIYKLNKVTVSDNCSALLLAGTFYPHYGNHNPFTSSGTAANYFLVAPIGKLNRINNYLKVEFPIFTKHGLLNTFFVGYNFSYEYSTIRNNPYEDLEHVILVGMVFKIGKLRYE
jgi:hypothetical protein